MTTQTEAVDSETVPTVAMTEDETEQLMDAVRKQVEYYFSKENLQSDAYLTSHMDANMTVAIATVMKVEHHSDYGNSRCFNCLIGRRRLRMTQRGNRERVNFNPVLYPHCYSLLLCL